MDEAGFPVHLISDPTPSHSQISQVDLEFLPIQINLLFASNELQKFHAYLDFVNWDGNDVSSVYHSRHSQT